MNSRRKLFELLKYIHSLEERSQVMYSDCLERVKDPEIKSELTAIRNEEAKHVQIADELLRVFARYVPTGLRGFRAMKRNIPLISSYLLTAILLGLGAPVGSIAIKFMRAHGTEVSQWIQQELEVYHWFYAYMALGTVLAFFLAGLFVALIHERLRLRNMELVTKTRILEDTSDRDSLTGLFNFGYIRERLAIEMERATRFQTPLSCLMLDVDHLKAINDSYGHTGGDEILSQLAKLIRAEIRVIDTAARYGGDEFFLILPVTPKSGACVLGERIRRAIKKQEVRYKGNVLNTTVSIGVATFPSSNIRDVESLVDTADQAVYEAKKAGGDRVVAALDAVQEARRMDRVG